MDKFNQAILNNLFLPHPSSHKGQNGKLMVIGGSHLFHAASLWALTIASKIVDMVFYSSVPENNQIVQQAKDEFRNGIIVLRDQIESYIEEADTILIGPGMLRTESEIPDAQDETYSRLEAINKIEDEGLQSYFLTKYLLEKYPHKKWVLDAGALQMIDPEWLLPLKGNAVLTPHPREFERVEAKIKKQELRNSFEGKTVEEKVQLFVKEYNSIVLLKGVEDVVCSAEKCIRVAGGNAGMTKGGTGDVLAGLVAALACKNDLFLAAQAGSYFNKQAGESLFKRVGYYFNASDLANEIPSIMHTYLTGHS